MPHQGLVIGNLNWSQRRTACCFCVLYRRRLNAVSRSDGGKRKVELTEDCLLPLHLHGCRVNAASKSGGREANSRVTGGLFADLRLQRSSG